MGEIIRVKSYLSDIKNIIEIDQNELISVEENENIKN